MSVYECTQCAYIVCSYILSILFFNLNNRNKLTDIIILALIAKLCSKYSMIIYIFYYMAIISNHPMDRCPCTLLCIHCTFVYPYKVMFTNFEFTYITHGHSCTFTFIFSHIHSYSLIFVYVLSACIQILVHSCYQFITPLHECTLTQVQLVAFMNTHVLSCIIINPSYCSLYMLLYRSFLCTSCALVYG